MQLGAFNPPLSQLVFHHFVSLIVVLHSSCSCWSLGFSPKLQKLNSLPHGPPLTKVDQRRIQSALLAMGRVSGAKASDARNKEALPGEVVDPQVEVLDDLYGKMEQTRLVDHDFTDGDLFPDLQPSVYMDPVPLDNGDILNVFKSAFEPLCYSSLMALPDLSTFGSTGEVAHCTEFMISRVHQNAFWLDRDYPIHAQDIHKLTGFSMEGQDVTDAFHGA